MNIVADLHTHTLVSTHAFATLNEMIARAKEIGYKAMAVTDHAIAMPDAPHEWYFSNVTSLPQDMGDGFVLLRGVEANVVEENGGLDMEQELFQKLDWVIASLHRKCIRTMNEEEATHLWLKVAENPYVDMIGHSEERRWKYDYDRVVPVFAQNHKVVELNANSPRVRGGNEENLRQLMLSCKRHGAKIALNSDAHSTYALGDLGWALELLEELDFPEELVVNSSVARLKEELALHGRAVSALL